MSVQRIQTIGTRALTRGHPFRSAPSSGCRDSYTERGGGGPRVNAGLGPELVEDSLDMVLDCLHGDHEPAGNLAVLQALVQ